MAPPAPGLAIGRAGAIDPRRWQTGLAAFQQLRPLGDEQLQLVACFDRTTVLMAGLNWLKSVYLDQRKFDDPPAVIRRIDEILQRLSYAAARPSGPAGLSEDKSR